MRKTFTICTYFNVCRTVDEIRSVIEMASNYRRERHKEQVEAHKAQTTQLSAKKEYLLAEAKQVEAEAAQLTATAKAEWVACEALMAKVRAKEAGIDMEGVED